MTIQRQSPRLALLLSANSEEVTQCCLLGFQVEDNSQDKRGSKQILQTLNLKSTTLLIVQVAWTSPQAA